MNYAVVYASVTGNTKMLAEEVRRVNGGEECVYFGTAGADVPEAGLIFAGFWTDKGTCEEAMAEFLKGRQNAKVLLFGTAGFGQSQEYFDRILSNVKSHLNESNTVEGAWMCQGKMPESVRKRYEAMGEQDPERAEQLIANFDQALGHPDEKDLEEFRRFIEKIVAGDICS